MRRYCGTDLARRYCRSAISPMSWCSDWLVADNAHARSELITRKTLDTASWVWRRGNWGEEKAMLYSAHRPSTLSCCTISWPTSVRVVRAYRVAAVGSLIQTSGYAAAAARCNATQQISTIWALKCYSLYDKICSLQYRMHIIELVWVFV